MSSNETKAAADGKGLQKGTIGIFGIVFFVIAAAAPLAGMTGAVPVAIVLGSGAGAPGAYLLVGLVLALFSVGYAAMTHRVTNAGAFFAYVGRGLGKNAGVGSAFVSMVAYLTVQWAVYGFFGAIAAGQMSAQFGIDFPWYIWSLIAVAIATVLSILRVDVGAKVLGVLMIAEILSMLLAGIAALADGGPEGWNLAASFSPSSIFAGGLLGTAGIAFAFAFAFASACRNHTDLKRRRRCWRILAIGTTPSIAINTPDRGATSLMTFRQYCTMHAINCSSHSSRPASPG